MAGGAAWKESGIAAWKESGIQALVLLSLTLQVALLMLAEFRRRVDSGAVRFLAWSAYMLADGTAIYVLGHLSAASRSPDHELMAFWAPFLLLHLGGQDNITAYAVEDNRLWLRHLQTFAVQVTAAGYVLFYTSVVVGSQSGSALLRWAGILMFVMGVVKYAERVWALRCAGSNPVGKNYQALQHSGFVMSRNNLQDILKKRPWDTEDCLLMAHRALGVPKEMIKGLINEAGYGHAASYLREEGRLYKVVEMQMYLMHDVLYTKAEVMHTWFGLCIRMLSPAATTVALLLFHRHQHRRHQHRVDVAVTYVLLIGALVLEVVSALRGLFSSWACVLLISHGPHYSLRETLSHIPGGRPRWWLRAAAWVARHVSGSLGRMVLSVRRLVRAADWARYWSASMGQHNLLQLAARSRVSKRSRMANSMGREVWWNAMAYSSSIPVSPFIQDLVVDYLLSKEGDLRLFKDDHDSLVHFDSRGQAELRRWGLYEGLTWSVEEKILVWHIATNIYIYSMMSSSSEEKEEHEVSDLAEAVQALSNYMLYLLASRPYMLGPTANHNSYIEVCFGLIARGPRDAAATPYSSPEEVARFLKTYGDTGRGSRFPLLRVDHTTQGHLVSMLDKGCELGAKIVQDDAVDTLELLAQVWVETLCYAGQRCSALCHAKQLSDGGELITVAAILVEYFKRGKFR
ncbi:hypothetical protein VPH35_057359 [Triticum aestivum]|uniref:uncharacterized protein n=1 Tax=Triticum aestivum TaxID=4565 RepID=UPI000842A271|nr:uncharacterized protein LOC123076838 [Triticum aestivum]XP_044354917.1 uncharacterized protein LOC123076838 [Triticum aestivum]